VTRHLTGHGTLVALLRRWLGGIALLGVVAQVTAGAAVLPEPDASAVRQVVQSQLEAFAADEPERAYGYASAAIRAQFGDASTFMAMVRGGYPMLVRPTAVSFFRAQAEGAAAPTPGTAQQAVQVVQVRDREGRHWRATYVLERQAGAGWRIGGCVVVADSGKSMT
jgi:Domain of unknown function (DUF4864)